MADTDGMVVASNGAQVSKPQSTVLECFSKLTKDSPKIRLKSSTRLIKHLTLGAEKDGDELKYTLGRLVRGLGATKNTLRVGFYTTLTALLQVNEASVVEDVMLLVEKELHTSGNNSKSENADILTGHTLVCGALFRSGQFGKASPEHQTKIVEMLLAAAKKKSYLSLIAYTFLVDALDDVVTDEVFTEVFVPAIKEDVTKPLGDLTLDQLYFLLRAQEKFPKVVSSKYTKKTVGHAELICEATVPIITEVLMSVLPIKQILSHPIYKFIGKVIGGDEHAKQFVTEIDNCLSKATQMRHSVAAVLLNEVAKNVSDVTLLAELLTDNFLKLSLSHFRTVNSKNQDELQLSIYALFESLVAALRADDVTSTTRVAVMKRLMFYPGTFIFEKITRSKVLQQITATLDSDGVKKLCKLYKAVLLAEREKRRNETETETWLNLDRVFAAQLISKLLQHAAVREDHEWRVEQLTLLMEVGLLKDEAGTIGTDLAGSLKGTFFHAIDLKLPRLEELRSSLSKLVHRLDEKMGEGVLRQEVGEEDEAIWKRAIKMITKLEGKTKKNHLNPVFHTLFLHMALQLFNEPKLAKDSLNELFVCYERTRGKGRGAEEDDVEWIEVVIDLFLNLLSHNSHLLRRMVGCVFPHLCKDVTPSGIHQILSVFDTKDNANPLSEDTDDSEEEEDDGDGGEEDGSSESENSDEEDETVNDKLRLAVQQALGNGLAHSDDESVDLDQMSDSECSKLNTALESAFRQYRPNTGRKSKKQSKEDETLTHFRVRVMDLIEIYLDSDPSMVICLEIMLPLLQALEFAIRDPHQKPLQDRLKSCLKKLSSLKKFGSVAEVDEAVLCELLKSLLERGSKSIMVMQELGDKISDCCIFIFRCMQNLLNNEEIGKKARKKMLRAADEILAEALETFFSKRDCSTPYGLFKNLLHMVWVGNIGIIPHLTNYAFDAAIRPFRRGQALELLRIFYSNHRLLQTHGDEFQPVLAEVEATIQANITTVLNNDSKEKFVSGLFTLLGAMKSSPVQTDINWEVIGTQISEFSSGVSLSKNTKAAFNRLCRVLKISNQIKMKPNAVKLGLSTTSQDDNEDEKVERRKRVNKEKQHKKETRLLRMQSLSEGFNSGFSFANTDLDGLQENGADEVVDMEQDEPATGKKRKNGDHKKSPKKKKTV